MGLRVCVEITCAQFAAGLRTAARGARRRAGSCRGRQYKCTFCILAAFEMQVLRHLRPESYLGCGGTSDNRFQASLTLSLAFAAPGFPNKRENRKHSGIRFAEYLVDHRFVRTFGGQEHHLCPFGRSQRVNALRARCPAPPPRPWPSLGNPRRRCMPPYAPWKSAPAIPGLFQSCRISG